MSERVSSERLLALRQVVAVSAHLSLGEQEQVLLDLLDARTAFNEFQDEWSERFGFLAIKNQRDSLESIDEVACILNAANHSIRGEMEEGWRIANKEGARADIAEQRIAELERERDGALNDKWKLLKIVTDKNVELLTLQREMIAWRAATQRITPGGSEFMDPESVERWAQKQNRELGQTKMDVVKLRRDLDEVRKALRWTWREEGLIEKGLPDVILAAFLAARAAAKEVGDE